MLETEREHDEFRTFDEYSSCPHYYDDDEEEEEDHTIEETSHWAQRYRDQASRRQRRHQPPPSTRSRNRKNQQQIQTRTSTGSVGSGFSLEVTIPEGSTRSIVVRRDRKLHLDLGDLVLILASNLQVLGELMVVGEILAGLLPWIADFLGLAVTVNMTATIATTTTMSAVAAMGVHPRRHVLL